MLLHTILSLLGIVGTCTTNISSTISSALQQINSSRRFKYSGVVWWASLLRNYFGFFSMIVYGVSYRKKNISCTGRTPSGEELTETSLSRFKLVIIIWLCIRPLDIYVFASFRISFHYPFNIILPTPKSKLIFHVPLFLICVDFHDVQPNGNYIQKKLRNLFYSDTKFI